MLAIQNVRAAISQIVQTTLRTVAGQHTLDQALAETGTINLDIRKILATTAGVMTLRAFHRIPAGDAGDRVVRPPGCGCGSGG